MADTPCGWVQACLEDVASVNWGNTSITKKEYTDTGYLAISAAGPDGFLNFHDHDGEGVILSAIGAGCGKCFWVDGKWTAIKNTIRIQGDTTCVYLPYIFQYLNRSSIWPKRGGAQPFIALGDARPLSIALPPLNEQHRIADKIDALQAKSRRARESLEAMGPLLEKFRQSVLAAAFRGDLTAEWRKQHPDVEPAEKLLERIRAERRTRWEEAELAKMRAKGIKPKDDKWKAKYTEPEPVDATGLPELPEGWCWARAEEICHFITKGTTPAKHELFVGEGEIPFVKVYNLRVGGDVDFSIDPTFTSRKVHESKLARSISFPNDVLMNIVGPPLGQVSVVPDLYPEWNVNQAIAIFRVLEGYKERLFQWWLLAGFVDRWFHLRAKATSGQLNLTLKLCRDCPVPIPPKAEQDAILPLLGRIHEKCGEIDCPSLLKKLNSLDQSILAKAFRGELVPQDPNDEPASVLLERIKAEREAATGKKKTRKKTE